MKQLDYTKQLAEGLGTNDQLKRLTLSKLNLTDQSVVLIAEALKRNKSLVYLDISNNKFGNVGLMAIADSLKENNTLIELSVIGQSQPFGEAALAKMTEMFEYNVILQKINWRLASRQSFALNKLISRNVDINRRIAAGQKLEDYINLVPAPRKPDFGVDSDFILAEGATIPSKSSKEIITDQIPKESHKEIHQEIHQEIPKEIHKESHQEIPKESHKESHQESHKEETVVHHHHQESSSEPDVVEIISSPPPPEDNIFDSDENENDDN
jgi:hypothetical protein